MAITISNPRARALLIDITRCIGCQACAIACKEARGFPEDPEDELSATAYTVVVEAGEDRYIRKLCMHCNDPACASACPVGALEKTAAGPVTYHARRCLGCRYCMIACPFSVPRYEWDNPVPSVRKCDLCAERGARGEPTVCSEACPVEATVSGTREELLAEAHRRIAENPEAYHPKVYGEHEVGGTSVLVLSPVPFEELGMKLLGAQPLPELTWAALEKIPAVVGLGAAALMGIHWITHRRAEVAEAARAARKEDDRA
jgi:formate dehydrogenase iron-sulfur subunit